MYIDENGKQHGRGSAKKALPDGVTAEVVIAHYLTGASVADTAAALSATKWQVEQIVKAAGVTRNGGAQYAAKDLPGARARGYAAEPLDPDVELEVVRVYQTGSSLVETAKTTGVSKYKVEKVIEKYGLARSLEQQYATGVSAGGLKIGRKPKEMLSSVQAEILRRYQAGESAASLAAEFGYDVHRVNKFIRKVLNKALNSVKTTPEGARVCATCREEKGEDQFIPLRGAKGDQRVANCLTCREEVVAQGKNLHRYGLTQAGYASLLQDQGGGCAICGNVNETGRLLCVDHCHTTHKIRGLLCVRCNAGLGHFKDSPQRLSAAIVYLTKATAAAGTAD